MGAGLRGAKRRSEGCIEARGAQDKPCLEDILPRRAGALRRVQIPHVMAS
jgi:hypothetical protein